MKNFLMAGIVGLTTFGSVAFAQTPSVTDAEFVTKASVGNTFEVEEAKIALQQASDAKLKQFAQKMIDDHTDAEKKLATAAGKAGDQPQTTLDQPHQAMLDNLKTFNGTDFDKIYIADQIAAHDETVNLLSDYKQNGQNNDLKSWADDSLTVVKGHKAMIDAM
ncbi:putative membrane protein [Faunimonas pinastri]|uniref:Putative membrane protein n=1 Tax=Faunimonas pinastri TaxID=1855383 RepID=A0A1H9LIM8_9HYPH|nr:DUF4142 domain-containing protein [Faunimonas pinastri]SER10975.1 putative membrane protein [Faunimonas pinastri]